MPEPTSFLAVEDLDAAETLAAVESAVRDRRAAEVRELELALHWADLHADDPRDGGRPVPPGGPRLVQLGGAGTPWVVDLSICELAVARGQHSLTVRALVADALDLRHRLPELYTAVREGRVDVWAARKVASMTRKLDAAAAGLVDRAVTDAVDQGNGRLLSIAEAKVIEADTDAARAERDAERRRRYVAVTRTDESGLRTVIAPVVPADAVWLDATVDRVADALDQRRDLVPDLPEDCTRDELRSVALGWLAHPDDVVALLAGEAEPRGHGAKTQAIVHVHLHQATLDSGDGVARVEGAGAMLLDELAGLLGHARVTLAPVIDLDDQHLGQRLRTPRGGQGTHPATHRRRRVPPCPDHQPQDRHGPPRPLRRRTAHPARPVTTTPPHSAVDLTAPRPTSPTDADSSVSRATCGTAPTAENDSSTPEAPTSSTPPKHSSSNTPEHSTRPSTGSKPASDGGGLDGEHRTGSVEQHLLGDAAHDHLADRGAVPQSDHHHVGVGVRDDAEDLLRHVRADGLADVVGHVERGEPFLEPGQPGLADVAAVDQGVALGRVDDHEAGAAALRLLDAGGERRLAVLVRDVADDDSHRLTSSSESSSTVWGLPRSRPSTIGTTMARPMST